MAGLPSKGKQPAKTHKPSRLRNEVRPESTDDERDVEKHNIQVPHSDSVIPDTQLQQDERIDGVGHRFDKRSDYGEEVPLSPNSADIIERNAVRKMTEALEPAPFTIKLLTKEGCGSRGTPAPSTSSAFSFGQVRKVHSKTSPKDDQAITDSATQANPTDAAVGHLEGQALDGVWPLAKSKLEPSGDSIVAMPAARSPLVAVNHTQQNPPSTDRPQPAYELLLPSHMATTPYHNLSAGPMGSELPESRSNTPPSAQPDTRPVTGAKKTRIVKRAKKGTRALLSQERRAPWPPRPYHMTGYRSQASSLVSLHDTAPADDHAFQEHGPVVGDTQTITAVPGHHGDVQNHHGYASRAVDDDGSQFGLNTFNALQHTAPMITAGLPVASSRSGLPVPLEHSSTVSFEQLSKANSEQALECVPEESATQVLPEQQSMRSQRNGSAKSRLRSINASEDLPGPANRLDPQSPTELVATQKQFQSKEGEAVLHDTSTQGGPHRVGKPHKKPRATNGLLPHRVHPPSMSSGIERSMQDLRVALLAEQFRTQHENKATTKHHEETIGMLRDMVSLQNDTIAESKEKHQNLGNAIIRMTEKAKTNQKYAAGLQKDYEKLQKLVTCFHDQSKKTLEEKIAEVESEKSSLRRDFEVTLDVLVKSQKNLRSTAEDLYVRLTNSESKKRDFAEYLSKHTVMYEEERRRRVDLEKQLLSAVQNTQRQLGDVSTALTDKLELLQTAIDGVAIGDDRDVGIKECLVALKKLQATPFITIKDVQKAEGMLRFVGERVDAGLGTLSSAVESKLLPTDEIQVCVKTEMQHLRTEILKYEDVLAEDRKAQESNATLKKELEAQKKNSQDLDRQIRVLQQNEADLETHESQLERELSDMRNTTRNQESELAELERGLTNLRQQVRNGEDDLQTANSRIDQTERLRQELEQEAAKYKNWYESAKAMLLKIDASAKQEKKTENAADLRAKIVEECQKSMQERESGFKNEIHRLTIECDEKGGKLDEQRTEVSAAKDQLHTLRKNAKILSSELTTTRIEKTALEKKLEIAGKAALRSDSTSAEIIGLKEELRQKTEELQSTTRDYAALKQTYADLSIKAADLQASYDQLQTQISQHLSTIDNLHQQTEDQILETRQNAQTAVQLAQGQILTLQDEKENLRSMLEQATSNEANLKNAQATFSIERDNFHQQLAELQAAKESKDAEMRRVQADAAEEKRKSEDAHCTEINDWSRRLTHADVVLKEAEAKLRLSEAEHSAKLESDRKSTEKMLQQLHEEYDRKLQEANSRNGPSQKHTARSSNVGEESSRSLRSIQAGSNRKKVNRNNHSVLNLAVSSDIRHDSHVFTSNLLQPDLPRTQREDSQLSFNLFEERSQNIPVAGDLFDDYGLSVIDPAAEPVAETQEKGSPLMTIEKFGERSQMAHHETKSQDSNLTDLSTVSSGEMAQMQVDAQPLSPPMLRGQDRSSPTYNLSQGNAEKTPMRSDNVSVSGSRSSRSHYRPRSQANTASRMMPPPEAVSPHLDTRIKFTAKHPMYEKSSRKLVNNSGTSTPDSIHPPSSASRYSYGHHDPQLPGHIEERQGPPQALGQSYNQKRKNSMSQTEKDTATKRLRISSQSYSRDRSSEPRTSSPCVPRSPVVGPRSNVQHGPSYPRESTPAASRSKTKPSSSRVPPSMSSRISPSNDMYQSRGQQAIPSQAIDSGFTRRTSSRLTKSKSRGQIGTFEGRSGRKPGKR
ncbi:uncharacterized protein K460DRAFT_350291 [Cucurbitaria berberidis CBS 394.84]|uniref:Uncharacterized protein n=1 Tax=Cucurbitaria berberidis CBS 394.84 TaxID=1168544 RepID=A0A9P4GRZ5_9PLEO|nr:uncharacterized protein K460DRAFT_350291 [Cucurbitaria berberidis CBS 394.84]KAF1850209.1 hypothetical protein K460DRAFT_350291 [Cucurbitaria berberidis CBS 394.84]